MDSYFLLVAILPKISKEAIGRSDSSSSESSDREMLVNKKFIVV
jgi:hypothetical protein